MRLLILLSLLVSQYASAEIFSGIRIWLQERSDIADLEELLEREGKGVKLKYEGLTEKFKYQVCIGYEYDTNIYRGSNQLYSGKLPKLRNCYTYSVTGVELGCDID